MDSGDDGTPGSGSFRLVGLILVGILIAVGLWLNKNYPQTLAWLSVVMFALGTVTFVAFGAMQGRYAKVYDYEDTRLFGRAMKGGAARALLRNLGFCGVGVGAVGAFFYIFFVW